MNPSETTDRINKLNENVHTETPVGDQNVEVTVQIVTPELPPPGNFILRRNFRSRISWISKCCSSSDLSESNEFTIGQRYPGEAPPIYYPRARRNFNDVQLFLPIDSRSSFEAYTPPPSYAQSQGIYMDSFSVNNLISDYSSSEQYLSSQPTFAICPRCTTYTLTIVEINRTFLAHFAAIFLLLTGCCCLIPHCLKSCQTVHHYCSICRTYIGTYTP